MKKKFLVISYFARGPDNKDNNNPQNQIKNNLVLHSYGEANRRATDVIKYNLQLLGSYLAILSGRDKIQSIWDKGLLLLPLLFIVISFLLIYRALCCVREIDLLHKFDANNVLHPYALKKAQLFTEAGFILVGLGYVVLLLIISNPF